MANLGLSELAKYGFVELEGALAKLERLVALVGNHGRSVLAELGLAADPDQALNALILLAESNGPQIRKLLSNAKSSYRLIRTLGASSAMVDLLTRRPELLEVLDVKQEKLPSVQELGKSFTDSIRECNSNETTTLWAAVRLNYRRELLRLVAFDAALENPQQDFEIISRHLSDLATEALQAGIAVARIELVSSRDHGTFSQLEVDNTRLAVVAMGKCGARELNYISDVDVIFVADSGSPDLEQTRALDVATKLATRMMRALDTTSSEPETRR